MLRKYEFNFDILIVLSELSLSFLHELFEFFT
jgi:hypothetical protein